MQNLLEVKEILKALKAKLAEDYAVQRIGVFGSFARE